MNQRAQHIAEAFEAIARVNHYLVGFSDRDATFDELDAARVILCNKQNASKEHSAAWQRLELALDLIEMEIKESSVRVA